MDKLGLKSNTLGESVGPVGSPIGAASGDLDGSYPSPTVVGVREANGVALALGAIGDGEVLKRVGSTIVSMSVREDEPFWSRPSAPFWSGD